MLHPDQNQQHLAAAARGLASSNSTTQHFLGGAQRSWMSAANQGAGPAAPVHSNLGAVPNTPPTSANTLQSDTQSRRPDMPAINTSNAARFLTPQSMGSQVASPQNFAMRTASPVTFQPTVRQLSNGSFEIAHPRSPQTPVLTSIAFPPNTSQQPPHMNSRVSRKRSLDMAIGHSPQLPNQAQSRGMDPPLRQQASPAVSSPDLAKKFVPNLERFRQVFQAQGCFNEIVSQRMNLVQDACYQNDIFYLCVHQFYCAASADPLFAPRIGLEKEHVRGLENLQTLLANNSILPPNVLKFFADFPSRDLSWYSSNNDIIPQVRAFLPNLVDGWEWLRQGCIARGYPPFAGELRVKLSVPSQVLQKVMFNSVHLALCDIHKIQNSLWSGRALAMFDQDQRKERERLKHYLPGPEHIASESRELGVGYLRNRNQTLGVIVPPITASPSTSSPIVSDQPTPTNLLRSSTAVSHSPQGTHAQSPLPVAGNERPRRGPGRPPGSRSGNLNNLSNSNAPSPASPNPAARPLPPAVQSTVPQGGVSNFHTRPFRPFTNMPRSPLTPVKGALLLPPAGVEPIQILTPNPHLVALHQAHLRSPKYLTLNMKGLEDPSVRLYSVPVGFALEPQFLGPSIPFYSWTFDFPANDRQQLAVNTVPPNPCTYIGKHLVRRVHDGTLLYRLRCLQAPDSLESVTESSWVNQEIVWPSCCFISCNNAHLEIRRKMHYGKDLPLDLTPFLLQGKNNVVVAMIRNGEETTTQLYALAIEKIELMSEDRLRTLPKVLPASEALDTIKSSLSQPPGNDDDIEVVDAHLSIDLTDPFMATIWDTPVRGRACTHRECFDLDTFLKTRKSRSKDDPGAPTSPDEWKCPICGKDARPQSLYLDGFLEEVKKELERRGTLQDTKAILVRANGTWNAKTETRQDRRSSEIGTRPSEQPKKVDGTPVPTSRGQSVVIELDD